MNSYPLSDINKQMREWRQQIHSHPETAFSELATAKLVVNALQNMGVQVYPEIAKTGVVGVLRVGDSHRSIALRADLDALDIFELNDFHYRSKISGKMHACGHDGHTAMLLGAAKYLAESKNFDGTVYFIFQPAEEDGKGCLQMLEEGLYEKFPADEIYGMHNMPSYEAGSFAIKSGVMLAAFETFECDIEGKGTHSSMPETGIDPIAVAVEIHQAWSNEYQSNFNPEEIKFGITKFESGKALNVIPNSAILGGSFRYYSKDKILKLREKMREHAQRVCDKYNTQFKLQFKTICIPLINAQEQAEYAASAAVKVVGEDKVERNMEKMLASEDFAYFLEKKPGAYILIGNSGEDHGGCMIHNPHYDFNDQILIIGASFWIQLVEDRLSAI
ncbi:MAG: amidohydrolase [Kangiellaceae bacterium]|nr:amidohydrolase [Kangiellaceae bacterium]